MNNASIKNKLLKSFVDELKKLQIIETTEESNKENSKTCDTAYTLSNFPLLTIKSKQWGECISIAVSFKCRWLGMWAKEAEQEFQITAAIMLHNQYYFLRTIISKSNAILESHAPFYFAASRFERHIHDLLGIDFLNSPDKRRWTKHKAWGDDQFPLRNEYSLQGRSFEKTPADSDYPFLQVEGEGVYEIPVGPVHAGIIEPGHFRFQVAGEDIIYLEERLGYLHKGIEKIAIGRDLQSIIKLASRISGDSAIAYAWATCQAIENSLLLKVPSRALFLRAILAERERISNHLWDIAAICNDVGFTFAYYQFGRLREIWLRTNAMFFGHRLLMDCLIIGGVKTDLNAAQIKGMQQEIFQLREELDDLYRVLEENSSLQNRLRTTGVLSCATALSLGALGYVGRASGIAYDVRRDNPYAPYDKIEMSVPIFNDGDVAARLKVRSQEILASLDILRQLLSELPADSKIIEKIILPTIEVEGVGIIEGWRGEILVYVSLDNNGKITRFFPRDPSWFNWLALERLVYNDIVPDFPVCNKSINGSYSGCDL